MLQKVLRGAIDSALVIAVCTLIYKGGQLSEQFDQVRLQQAADKAEHQAARKAAIATQLRLQRLEIKANISTPVEVDADAAVADPQP